VTERPAASQKGLSCMELGVEPIYGMQSRRWSVSELRSGVIAWLRPDS
jgi:hypothetical protein